MINYETTLSSDQKQIGKKFWCIWDKSVYQTDGTTMVYVYNGKKRHLGKYQHIFKNVFKDELKDGKTLHTVTIAV